MFKEYEIAQENADKTMLSEKAGHSTFAAM